MKIRIFVNMNLQGCDVEDVIEIPDEEWNDLSKEEQEEMLNEYANNLLENSVDFGAREIKEG